MPVLPLPKPGHCPFCTKRAATHLLPVCECWARWLMWRFELNDELQARRRRALSPPPLFAPARADDATIPAGSRRKSVLSGHAGAAR